MPRMRTFLVVAALTAAAVQSLAAQDWESRRWRRGDGLHVRVAKSYHLPPDQVVSWPVVVIGGSATIDGRLEDDLVVIGGSVTVGPTAHVRGDIVAVGGAVEVASAAEVTGEIHDVSVFLPEFGFVFRDWWWGLDRGWWAAFTLAATVFRFTLTLVAACFLALVAPLWIRRIEERVTDAPLAAGAAGIAGQLLIVPLLLVTVAGLVITIIGIPLLVLVPFAMLAFVVAWVAGFTSVAAQIGGRARQRARLAAPDTTALDAAWGVLLLFAVTFAGNLLAFGPPFMLPLATAFSVAGFVIEYLAWTFGLGAALLAPLYRRWHTSPPPVPTPVSASA